MEHELDVTFETAKMTAIFDLNNFGFRDFFRIVGVFRRIVGFLEAHYVGRCDKIVILNAPSFKTIAKAVFPMLPVEIREKIQVSGKNYQEELREILVEVSSLVLLLFRNPLSIQSEMPSFYGGDDTRPPEEHPFQKESAVFVAKYLHPDSGNNGAEQRQS